MEYCANAILSPKAKKLKDPEIVRMLVDKAKPLLQQSNNPN